MREKQSAKVELKEETIIAADSIMNQLIEADNQELGVILQESSRNVQTADNATASVRQVV